MNPVGNTNFGSTYRLKVPKGSIKKTVSSTAKNVASSKVASTAGVVLVVLQLIGAAVGLANEFISRSSKNQLAQQEITESLEKAANAVSQSTKQTKVFRNIALVSGAVAVFSAALAIFSSIRKKAPKQTVQNQPLPNEDAKRAEILNYKLPSQSLRTGIK